jgi:hypothetical protein
VQKKHNRAKITTKEAAKIKPAYPPLWKSLKNSPFPGPERI